MIRHSLLAAVIGILLGCPPCGEALAASAQGGEPLPRNRHIFGLVTDPAEAVDADFFARYGLLLLSVFPESNPAAAYRARNEDIVLLANANPFFATGFTLYPEYISPEKVKPQWVLKAPGGEVIRYAGPKISGMRQAPSLMDPRVKAWRREFMTFYRHVVSTYALDGLLLDSWGSQLPPWARHEGRVQPADFTPARWSDLMKVFSAEMRGAFRDHLLIFNGLAVAPEHTGPGDADYLATFDGAAYEAFSIDLQFDRDVATLRHFFDHAIFDAMLRARAQNKYFLLQAFGREEDARSRRFAYGSFLLQVYDKAFFYYDAGDKDAANWFSEWNLDIGEATADAAESGGLHSRAFEKGLVLVNGSDQPRTFALHGGFIDEEGRALNAEIELPGFSARILRNAD